MSDIDESEFQHVFTVRFVDEDVPRDTYCGITGSPLPERDDQPFCPTCTLSVIELFKAGVRAAINAKRDTAQAREDEREAVAGWLDKLGDAEKWATGREDIATRYRGAAKAVRNGEHAKEEA